MSEAQPLAVQLARERFRQQAMAGLLTGMNVDPAAVSHDLGGELWLILTQSACDRIEEEQAAGISIDELIESIRGDLSRACHLVLERDRQTATPSFASLMTVLRSSARQTLIRTVSILMNVAQFPVGSLALSSKVLSACLR